VSNAYNWFVIEEIATKPRGFNRHEEEPTITRSITGLYSSEDAALKNAETCAALRPGHKYYICEVLATTTNAPHTTRVRTTS
jgi:hypothetical protein